MHKQVRAREKKTDGMKSKGGTQSQQRDEEKSTKHTKHTKRPYALTST